MKTYVVSFIHNDIHQSNIVITNKSPEDIKLWFETNRPEKNVIGISIATDTIKPGQPIIKI